MVLLPLPMMDSRVTTAGEPSADAHQHGADSVSESALLSLDATCADGALRAQKITVEVLNARSDADPLTLRTRRGQLVEAHLEVDLRQLGSWLHARATAPLAAQGIDLEALRVSVVDATVEISGEVAIADQPARFVLLGSVEPWGARYIRLAFQNLYIFGTARITAPRLIEHVLTSARTRRAAGVHGTQPLARIVGSSQLVVDILGVTLIQGLATKGWRLPCFAGAMLEDIDLVGDKLRLAFGGTPPHGAADPSSRLGVPEVRTEDVLGALEQELAGLESAPLVEQLSELARDTPTEPRIFARLTQELSAAPLAREYAIRLAQELREREPACADAWLAEANIRARTGESDLAVDCYRRFAELVGDRGLTSAELEARLAVCAQARRQGAESVVQDAERALQIAPDSVRALQHAARIYAELGRWEDLTRVRQRQVANAGTDTERARLQLALGELHRVHLARPHRAAEHYRAALAIQPNSELALSGLSDCCIDADDLPGAIEALDKLAAIATGRGDTPGELRALLRAASLLEHGGQPRMALQRLERLKAAGHSDPQLTDRIAVLLHRLGQSNEASELIRLQLAREESTTSRAYLEQLLDEVEESDEAEVGHWTKLAQAIQARCEQITTGPEAMKLRLELARILEQVLGQPAEALAVYADAASIAPEATEVLEPYADCCFRQRRWDEAKKLYTRLCAHGAPWCESAAVAYRMGTIEGALENSSAAEDWFGRALERDPSHVGALTAAVQLSADRRDDDATFELATRLGNSLSIEDVEERVLAHEQLGAIHLRRGDVALARELLEGALALEPRRVSTITLLRDACANAGDHSRVIALTEVLIGLAPTMEQQATLLRQQSMTLNALADEEGAIECLLRAHDLDPTHLPTIRQLIDHYWHQGDLETVVELGEEASQSGCRTERDADVQDARLALAVMLTSEDLERAVRWLAPLLSDSALAESALIELGRALEQRGIDRVEAARRVAQLVRGADGSGRAWDTLQELARDTPRGQKLADLLTAL